MTAVVEGSFRRQRPAQSPLPSCSHLCTVSSEASLYRRPASARRCRHEAERRLSARNARARRLLVRQPLGAPRRRGWRARWSTPTGRSASWAGGLVRPPCRAVSNSISSSPRAADRSDGSANLTAPWPRRVLSPGIGNRYRGDGR
jgi:hypothetical protein